MNVEHSPAAATAAPTITDGARFTLICQAQARDLERTSLFHWLQIDDGSLVEPLNAALTQHFYCTQAT